MIKLFRAIWAVVDYFVIFPLKNWLVEIDKAIMRKRIRLRCIKCGQNVRKKKVIKGMCERCYAKERRLKKKREEIERGEIKKRGRKLGQLKVNVDRDWLYQKAVEEKKSLRELAKVLGCSHETTRTLMTRFNIPMQKRGRKKKEAINKSDLRKRYDSRSRH